MKKYLIVKCTDYYDDEPTRTPICLVDDYKTFKADYNFEAYELDDNNNFSLVKNYDDYMGDEGMGLFCIEEFAEDGDEIFIIGKFPGLNRHSELPKRVQKLVDIWKDDEDFDNSLENCGNISWRDGNLIVWYGEYSGNHIYTCW